MLVAQDTQDRPRCAGRVGILVARGIREETLGCCRELLTYRSCSDVRPSQVENINLVRVKFIYSKKATKFCEISTLLLTGTTQDKSKVEFPQNFVAFSEYINFTKEGREDYSENLFP